MMEGLNRSGDGRDPHDIEAETWIRGESPDVFIPMADETDGAPSSAPPPGSELAAWLLMARRLREEVLGADLFSDPAWDILLDVYAGEARGVKIQISSLAPMSGVPSSTARRWADKLVRLGLLERERDEKDRRQTYIRLSRYGRTRICLFIKLLMAKGPLPPVLR